MYRTHRCSVHVASCVSIYGYGTPPPQDRARRARDRMINVFIYNLLTYITGIIYIIAVDLGVSVVIVLLASSSPSSHLSPLSSLPNRGTFP